MKHTHNRKKLKRTYKLAITLLALTCHFTAPAYALPGENIKSVLRWAQKRSFVPKGNEDNKTDFYSGETNFEKGQLFYKVSFLPSDGIVTEESVKYRNSDQDLNFTRTGSDGLRLLQKIYGKKVAQDFRDSDYITRVGSSEFYRGLKFGYITSSNQGFTVTRLEDLEAVIRRARFCEMYQCGKPTTPPQS